MDQAVALTQPLAPGHLAEGSGHEHGHDHAHSPHLAHHFDSLEQQFSADKFGMWLFLVTEIMFFSGLFCAYAVYRSNHPEIFEYADHFLDRNLGATNTVVLLFSSLTMAWGVRCAQLSQQRGLQICLALTLVCAMGFLGIKYVEYKAKFEHGLLWGQRFKPTEHLDKDGHIVHDSHEGGAGEHAGAADAGHGGEHGGGQPAIPAAPPMVGGTKAVPPGVASSAAPKTPSPSSPVATTDPGQAALSATENPRIAQQPVAATTTPVVPSSASKTGTAAPTASSPNPASPASGADPTPPIKVEEISLQPSNVQIFFGIYFCMTGLHAIHILVGIGLITWLLVRSIKGEFTDGYYTPVDLIGLYWHIVDMIWIYLFPLLYLIH